MTAQQSTILQLLSKTLFRREVEVQDQDWLEVLKEAKNQAVVQLVDSVIDKSLLTADEAHAWKQATSADLANNIRIGHNHSLLHKWMSGIPYVILKGAASASYYPIPTHRSMGDVDFLVKEEDLARAGKVLEENGLKPWDKEHISHIVYRGPRMHYEMHFNIAGTPNGEVGDLAREYTTDIFEKAQEKTVVNGVAMLPSPFHHGLILLLHTCHHMTGEGVGLRHLCDWAVFENNFSEDEFCELFEVKLKKLGLWKFAQILTRVSIKYLGADEKLWAIAEEDVVDAIMEDILTGGNFGKKDSDRALQTMLISDRGKDGVGKTSMVSEFLKSGNGVVYHNWPESKKNKLLLPFGWVYFGTRRIFREMTGKRQKTNVRKLVGGAAERRSLYEQLHLYETEL